MYLIDLIQTIWDSALLLAVDSAQCYVYISLLLCLLPQSLGAPVLDWGQVCLILSNTEQKDSPCPKKPIAFIKDERQQVKIDQQEMQA